MKRLPPVIVILAVLVALLAAGSSALYMVGEAQQALVVRLGRPIAIETAPGLKAKIPFVDTVIFYDTRQLPLEPPAEEIILGDQKRVEVSTYTRFRIVDPLRFFQSVYTLDAARSQLAQNVSASLRRELGQVDLGALLSDERAKIAAKIRAEVAQASLPLGIETGDVRILSADLPIETSEAIYGRMRSEREREAKELRAQGFELAQEIMANADRERTVILAEAQRQSSISRGAGDAAADQLFVDAFGKDPAFYAFFRSMKTYRQTLAATQPMLVLTPDSQLLHYFDAGLSTKPSK